MPLPLMPGSEPVELKYAPAQPVVAPSGYGLPGCNCRECRELNDRALVWPEAAIVPQPVTSRVRTGFNPAPQNLPREYPIGLTPDLVRGTYDFSQRTDGGDVDTHMHGLVRWLDTRSGECFDSDGVRQWQFYGGGDYWRDRNGIRFVLDPPAAPVPTFDWDTPTSPMPRPEQYGVNAGRVRGQYDPTHPESSVFRDSPRWLSMADGKLYDACGMQANTLSLVQGVWRTTYGLAWVPV